MATVKRVLFLCTANSARSQMAEGWMRSLGSGKWDVQSGGTFPSFVHPLAVQVMKEIGIDMSHQKSKSMNQFLNEEFDAIITLCEEAAISCPAFPGKGKRLHWPLEDPAAAVGSMEQKLAVFRRIRGEIKRRIDEFLRDES